MAGSFLDWSVTGKISTAVSKSSNSRLSKKARKMGVGALEFLRFANL